MPWADILSAVFHGITAAAAAVGACAAWRGVSTWRKQLVGQNEYELAKRLLLQAYQFERAIREFRKVWYDQEDDPDQLRNEIRDVGSQMNLSFLEGRVQWGEPFFKLKEEFLACSNELYLSVGRVSERYLERVGERHKNELIEKHEPIARCINDDETDEFSKRMRQAVVSLEDYLRPHIKR